MPAFLVHSSVKATVVLLVAWLLTRAMARCSAAARHLVWTLAIIAALVFPLLGSAVPRWSIPVLPASTTVVAASAVTSVEAQAPIPLMEMPGVGQAAQKASRAASSPASVSEGASSPWAAISDVGWAAAVMAVWIAGLTFALARLAAGLAWVSRITREALAVDDPAWAALLQEFSAAFAITTPVSLKMSADATIPVVCGIRKPTILLPIEANEWPAARRRVVLLHELAHVARRDCLMQTLAQVVRAVYWFNPLAHVAASRLRAEQERASDDLVLAAGTDAPDYADHLFELARRFRTERYPSWATLAMARPSQIEGRVLDILDERRNRQPLRGGTRAAVCASAAALMLPIGALQLTAAVPDQPLPVSAKRAALGLADAPSGFVVPDDIDVDGDFDVDPDPGLDPDPDGDAMPNPRPTPTLAAGQAAPPQTPAVSAETRRRVADALLTALNDENEDVRVQALAALAEMRDPRAIPGLVKASRDASADVRELALTALMQFDAPEAADAATAALEDASPDVRERAARLVASLASRGRMPRAQALSALLPLLKDVNPDVREQAAAALGSLADPEAINALTAALKDADADVREGAARALGRIARGERRGPSTPPSPPTLPTPPPSPPVLPTPPRVPRVMLDTDAIDKAVQQAEDALRRTMPTLLMQQQELQGDLLRQAEEMQREAERLVR
jgi:beta-lactamase regulating signal transducer with metallopeptidase domain/HEAT repeat protein